MARKRKKGEDDSKATRSIFDDRRTNESRDKHIVVVERRQSRFDDAAWYLKTAIPVETVLADASDSSKEESDA